MTKKTVGLFFVLSLILTICSCAPVTIDTVPTGADVYSADGKTELGTTPFDTSIFVGDKNYIVRKARYFDEPVSLNYDSERNVIMKFRPTPVLVYTKPGAEIYPDGSETSIGTTPMKVPVADKDRTYTLKAKDYYDQNITVGIDSPDPLIIELARRPIVTISVEPEGVEVYENGKRIGSAPIREEILTPRTFELRKAGYFTQTGTITGAPPYEIHTVLRPFPVITVSAAPADAQVYREGGLIGKAPVQLAVGEKTELEVRADRYYTQNIVLTPESPAQVNVELKAMPYVTINSEPAGAEVFIAEKSIGSTPVEQLIEKDTVIELRKEGFETKTTTLTGADKQITVTLEAIPAQTPAAPAPAPAVSETQPAAPAVAAEAPAPAAQPAAKGNNLFLIAGVAVIVAILAILLILKRKKK
ncbi:MAG: PEGA domain-containing protein [Kiritimatiellales bacterium]